MHRPLDLTHLSQKEIDVAGARVDELTNTIAQNFEGLTGKQRQATLKFRSGGHTIVPIIADLARRYGADLPGMPIDQMEARLAFAQRLAPLARQVTRFAMLLNDLVYKTESDVWQTATATYKTLKRMGKAVPHLKEELAPVVTFFAVGKKGAPPAGDASAPAPEVAAP